MDDANFLQFVVPSITNLLALLTLFPTHKRRIFQSVVKLPHGLKNLQLTIFEALNLVEMFPECEPEMRERVCSGSALILTAEVYEHKTLRKQLLDLSLESWMKGRVDNSEESRAFLVSFVT